MKKYIQVAIIFVLMICISGCGNDGQGEKSLTQTVAQKEFIDNWSEAVTHVQQVMYNTPGIEENISKEDLGKMCDTLRSDIESQEVTDEITAYYRLKEIVATSKMVHMGLSFQDDKVRDGENGLNWDIIWMEEGPVLNMLPMEYQKYVGTVLTHINSFTMQEVLDRCAKILTWETENGKKVFVYNFNENVLKNAGIMKEGDKELHLTVKGETGEESFDFSLDKEISEMQSVCLSDYDDLSFTYQMKLDNLAEGTNYSYRTLKEKNMLYFQYLACAETENRPFDSFFNEMMGELEKNPDIEDFVIDVRWNSGGNRFILQRNLERYQSLLKDKKIKIILGYFTASSACQAYEDCLQKGFDVTSYGEGTQGAVHNYTEVRFEDIDEVGLVLMCPTKLDEIPELIKKYGAVSESIEPDVHVEITREDFCNGIDTIIEKIVGK